jgi:pre-mRNA-processing factor 17
MFSATRASMATSSLGLLASNYEEECEEEAPAAAPNGSGALVVNPTPIVVGDYGGAGSSSTALSLAAPQVTEDQKYGQQVMKTNPTYEEMWAPEQGPALDPASRRAAGIKSKQRFVGHVARYEPATDFAFEEQYHTFNAYGFAYDPSTGAGSSGQDATLGPQQASVAGVVGDVERWAEARGESVYSRKGPLESKMEEQRKRLRLDENYEQIPTAQPELTAEQKTAIEERLKQEKRKCAQCPPRRPPQCRCHGPCIRRLLAASAIHLAATTAISAAASAGIAAAARTFTPRLPSPPP